MRFIEIPALITEDIEDPSVVDITEPITVSISGTTMTIDGGSKVSGEATVTLTGDTTVNAFTLQNIRAPSLHKISVKTNRKGNFTYVPNDTVTASSVSTTTKTGSDFEILLITTTGGETYVDFDMADYVSPALYTSNALTGFDISELTSTYGATAKLYKPDGTLLTTVTSATTGNGVNFGYTESIPGDVTYTLEVEDDLGRTSRYDLPRKWISYAMETNSTPGFEKIALAGNEYTTTTIVPNLTSTSKVRVHKTGNHGYLGINFKIQGRNTTNGAWVDIDDTGENENDDESKEFLAFGDYLYHRVWVKPTAKATTTVSSSNVVTLTLSNLTEENVTTSFTGADPYDINESTNTYVFEETTKIGTVPYTVTLGTETYTNAVTATTEGTAYDYVTLAFANPTLSLTTSNVTISSAKLYRDDVLFHTYGTESNVVLRSDQTGTYQAIVNDVYYSNRVVPDFTTTRSVSAPQLEFDGYNRLNLSNITPTSTTLGVPDGTTRDLTTQSKVYIYKSGTYTANVQTSETFAYLSNTTGNLGTSTNDVSPSATTISFYAGTWNGSYEYQLDTSQTTDSAIFYELYNIGGSAADNRHGLEFRKETDGSTKVYAETASNSLHPYTISINSNTPTASVTISGQVGQILKGFNSSTLVFEFTITSDHLWTTPKLSFDGFNKLAIENITQTSSTLKYGSNTYDTNTASNVYVTDAGEYKLEARDANTFVMSNVYVGGVSQHPSDVVPTLTFDGYNKLTIDNVDTVETVTIKKDGAAFATTTSNTVYIRDTGTYTAEVKGSGAYAIELSNVVTGTQHPTDVVPSLTYDNYNKITLENMNYEDTATVSDPNGSIHEIGTAKTMYVKDTGEYVFKISGTDKYVESNVYVSSVDLEGAPTKPIDFDGYNKLTLIDAGSNVSANVTYFSNTYELGSANVLYINGAGTYDLEMSGSNVFALSNTVVSAVDTTITEFAFHYEAFNSSYYSDKYSSASDAAAAGVVYSDTATGTYSWGTLNSIDTSTSGQVGYSWTPSSAMIANVLIVGGGGGGGNGQNNVYWSSAGGGGKVQNLTNQTISVGTYSIVVGNGSPNSTAGTTSSAFGTSAVGGGAGSVGTSGTSGSGNGPGSNSGYNVGGGGGDASSGGNAGNKGGSGGDGSNVSWLDGSIYGEQVGGQAYFGGGGFGGDSGGPTTGKGNNLPGTGGGGSYGQVGRSGIVVIRSGPTSEPPSLTFDGYNKLTVENFTTTESDTRTAKLTDPNDDTYSLGQTQNDIYIEETGEYILEVTNSDQSAVVKTTIGAGQISEPPESYVPSNASTSIPTLITNIPFISGSWSSTLSAERHSDFDYDTRIVYRQKPWPNVSSTYNIMAYDYVTKRWYDEGSGNPSVITDTSTYVSGQTYTSQNPKKVYGWSGPTGLLFEIDNPYYVDYSPPSLTFDTYNKLSIENITPTSTTLTDPNGSSFDIGTASNVYIEHAGTYKFATGDANTFALVSNVVGAIATGKFDPLDPNSVYSILGTAFTPSTTSDTQSKTSLSNDGTRVLVDNETGYFIQVYEYSSGSWTQLGSDINYGTSSTSSRISGDGNRVCVGISSSNQVKVYEYSSGSWSQIGTTITGSNGFGTDTSLNYDGTRLMVGAYGDYNTRGNQTVWQESGGNWTQLGSTLYCNHNSYPHSLCGGNVDINNDGTVVCAGGYKGHSQDKGCLHVWKYNGSSWTQSFFSEGGNDHHSNYCRLSGDGKVVMYSHDRWNEPRGRVNFYENTSADTWSQIGGYLEDKKLGDLSNDGKTVVVGKSDASIDSQVYRFDGSAWVQLGSNLEHTSTTLSISSDGSTVAIGNSTSGANKVSVYKGTTPSPSLTYDTSNKLSIANLTPTSTTLTDPNGSSFDIGTASNVYIRDSGTYSIASKDANTFLLASNTVTGTPTGTTYVYDSNTFTTPSQTYDTTKTITVSNVPSTLTDVVGKIYKGSTAYTIHATTSSSNVIIENEGTYVSVFTTATQAFLTNAIDATQPTITSDDTTIEDAAPLVTTTVVGEPLTYKAYLKTGINVNASTSWTAYDIFGSGYSEEINQGGFTLANSNLVAPETGYYRLSFNIYIVSVSGTGERTHVGVKPRVEGTDLNEISASNYIRVANGHDEASTSMSTIIYLTGNKEVNLKFARLSTVGRNNQINPGSLVTLEKVTTSTLYKAYLKTGINVNASTSWTAYDIFGSGYSEEINQGGFTLANSNLVAPETGYYRLSFNVYVYSTGDRTNVGVKPTVEGTDLNEISASDYIRNYEGHNEASTNMSTIVYLSGNKEVNLKFARLTDTTTSVTIQSGSFITLEKI
jgi:hypothetical protein